MDELNKPSKFESPENIKLTSREEDLKQRLQKEIMRRDGLQKKDAQFKAMADIEDSTSLLENQFDFDGKGQFLKGPDGYALGEAVDYHDIDGKLM